MARGNGKPVSIALANDCHDGEVLNDVLDAIEAPIEQVSTDGATTIAIAMTRLKPKEPKRLFPAQGCQDLAAWQWQR